jgi:hypothetical protein
MTTRILSYGGGLDSWTMLLLVVNGELPKPDLVIFADVSNGSPEEDPTEPGEWPSTYRHIREVVMPLCERHGIEFKWLTTAESPIRPTKANPEGHMALYRYFRSERQFPGRLSKLCTIASKVERIGNYVDQRFPKKEIEVWIGFGADEQNRLKNNRYAQKGRRTERYPLMARGMCRCREEAYCRKAPYPVPRKSACVFCPMSSRFDWMTLAKELPEQFAAAQLLEDEFKGTGSGEMMTFSGKPGVKLADHIAKPFNWRRARENQTCSVCGSKKATKRTGCDYLCGGRQQPEQLLLAV